MNSSLSLLHPYPFEKLNQLFKNVQPANLPLIPLSIGEPKHPAPEFVKQAIIDNFAPVNEQLKWEGSGQRYWVNEEFWAGKGAPIFVFIGILIVMDIKYIIILNKDFLTGSSEIPETSCPN
jgi:hypothetical protein